MGAKPPNPAPAGTVKPSPPPAPPAKKEELAIEQLNLRVCRLEKQARQFTIQLNDMADRCQEFERMAKDKNGINDAIKWTNKLPTKEGGYWCEIDGERKLAHVYIDWNGESTASGYRYVLHVFFAGEEPDYCQLDYLPNKEKYKWYGPFQEPPKE